MSELSRLLDDVYRTTIAAGPPAWSSDDALDEAFADWVPGPPDEAPAAERAYVTDEQALPADDETVDDTPSFERLFAAGQRTAEEPARAGAGADGEAVGAVDQAFDARPYLPFGTESPEPLAVGADTHVAGTVTDFDYDDIVVDTVARVDDDDVAVGAVTDIDYDDMALEAVAGVDDEDTVADIDDELAVARPAPSPLAVTAPVAVPADVAAPDAVTTTATATTAEAPFPPRWQPSDDDILPARKHRRLRRR